MGTTATSPAPLALESSEWAGNDGNWSTFLLSAGTPPQSFSVLPSTVTSETWLPSQEGCEGILANITSCPSSRGVHPFYGFRSLGFQTNSSSTWETLGIYSLNTSTSLLPYDANGLYGDDTLTLTNSSGSTVSLQSQVLSLVSTRQVWLGLFGLGPAEAGFPSRNDPIPSMLDTLASNSIIPGRSFGYTAGAWYAAGLGAANLVLGGYDRSRYIASNVTFPLINSPLRPLQVTVASIIVEGLSTGTASLLPLDSLGVRAAIDSTTAQSWLPQSVCDLFATTFQLSYDPSTELFLVNDTTHSMLLDQNPSVTFAIGAYSGSNDTANIVLPYSAFDLQVGIPYYNSSTNYFPIRVAANKSVQVLGRAFMQEVYLVVDWDRGNFTLGQANHQDLHANIIAISSPPSTSNPKHGLSGGSIAGIVIGVLVLCSILAALGFFLFRWRKNVNRRRRGNYLPSGTEKNPAEVDSDAQIYQLDEQPIVHEVSAHKDVELEGSQPIFEADSREIPKHEVATTLPKIIVLGEIG